MVAGVVDSTKLVFVDECGTHTSLAPVPEAQVPRKTIRAENKWTL
jgi:hypothetical protein